MQTLWRIGEAVLGGQKPPGEYTFLRDHTGDLALFWRTVPTQPWTHYTFHPLWNESRIEGHSVRSAVAAVLGDGSASTPWLPLMRKLKNRGWVLLELKVNWNHR